MKLRTKLLLLFLIISIAPLTLFLAFVQSYHHRSINQQISQFGQNTLEQAGRQLEKNLENVQRTIDEMYLPFSENYSIADYLQYFTAPGDYTSAHIYACTMELENLSRNLTFFSPWVNGLLIFTPSGYVFSTDNQNLLKTKNYSSYSEDDWYKTAVSLAGETYIYGPSHKWFFRNKDASVSFCTALYGPINQEFLGVLMIDCSCDFFDISAYETVPGLLCAQVTDSSGNVCYSLRPGEENGASLTFEKPLSRLGLSVSFSFEQSGLFQHLNISLYAIYYLASFCLLNILLFYYLLSKMVTTPITVLAGKMKEADLKQDVSTTPYFLYGDEIGTLYNAYQKMLDDINAYEKNELKLELAALEAKMYSLEAQINAHFLYNTLEAINSSAVLHNVPDISTMALSLGSMFRYSIKTTGELVPLSQELQHVHDYLSILNIRFGGAFHYTEQIPEALSSLRVLKLILQPLVENALYHGLNNCRTGDRITLTAYENGRTLCIVIADNGCGIEDERLRVITQQLKENRELTVPSRQNAHGSIGLQNINARIALYYGNTYGLCLASEKNRGTAVTVKIPVLD